MKYIVIFGTAFQQEAHYCLSLQEVKELIEELCINQKERDQTRVFRIESEIDINSLNLKKP